MFAAAEANLFVTKNCQRWIWTLDVAHATKDGEKHVHTLPSQVREFWLIQSYMCRNHIKMNPLSKYADNDTVFEYAASCRLKSKKIYVKFNLVLFAYFTIMNSE